MEPDVEKRQIEENVVTGARYFYYRDKHHRPLVTVTMLERVDGAIAYGWAICSSDDAPRYGKINVYLEVPNTRNESWVQGGKTIAYSRALAAFTRGTQIVAGIWRYSRTIARKEALMVIEACHANGLLALVWHNTTAALSKTMQPPVREQH